VLTRLADVLRLDPRFEDSRYRLENEDAATKTESYVFRRLFPTVRSSARRFARVAVERVRADAGVVGIEWRVTPDATLKPEEKRSWGARLRAWQNSPEWSVEVIAPGTYRVTEHMTLRALRAMVVSTFGEEDAGLAELPLTVAPPIAPAMPLTPLGVKLILRKLMPHIGGEIVPLDVLRDVVSAIPGWGWTEGRIVAEPLDDRNDQSIVRSVRKLTGLGRSVESQFRIWRKGTNVELYFYNPAVLFPTAASRTNFAAILAEKIAPPGPWTAGDVLVGPTGLFGVVRGWTDDKTFVVENVWQTVPAVVVSNPRGTAFAVTDNNGTAFWDWAFFGGLARDAEGVLASYGPDTVAEYLEVLKYKVGDVALLARCQICDRIQMTRKGHDGGGKGAASMVMADHGYTYPHSSRYRGGELGHRSGVCFGAKWQPYERDHRAIDAYIPHVQDAIAQTKMVLMRWQVQLREPDARESIDMEYGVVLQHRRMPWTREHPKYVTIQPEDSDWHVFGQMIAYEVAEEIADLEFKLRMLMQRRERWRPIPTFGERVAPVAKVMSKSED